MHAERSLLVHAPGLDLEQVGEVGVEHQLDRAERGFLAEVLDLEVFPHPAPDVAAAVQHQVRVGVTLRGKRRATRTRR